MVGSDHCPMCRSDSRIISSRTSENRPYLRRRKCLSCRFRWSTHEIYWHTQKAKRFKKVQK